MLIAFITKLTKTFFPKIKGRNVRNQAWIFRIRLEGPMLSTELSVIIIYPDAKNPTENIFLRILFVHTVYYLKKKL